MARTLSVVPWKSSSPSAFPQAPGDSADFGFLQIRPLVLSREGEELRLDEVDSSQVVCQSSKVLGNGRISDLRDVVMVDFHRFERAKSKEVARGVANFNAQLQAQGSPYLLIGVGRGDRPSPGSAFRSSGMKFPGPASSSKPDSVTFA